MSLIIFLACLVSSSLATISEDLNCTVHTTEFVYTPAATACANVLSDEACAFMYPPAVPADGYPKAGGNAQRPYKCYTTGLTGGPISGDLKKVAMENCPKTCGLCCQNSAYSCKNVQFPRMNCDTITASQCQSASWRPVIAQDCPAACGFCLDGGCVDAVPDCANDITICNAVNMQVFVNANCQKTCGRCPSNPTNPQPCKYNADSASACASWAANGFCTNPFYNEAQRKLYCATTCKIC